MKTKESILEDFKSYLIEVRELMNGTIRIYLFTLRMFIDFAGLPPYKTQDIVNYMSMLKKRKYKSGYIQNHRNVIKAFYAFLGKESPFPDRQRKGKRHSLLTDYEVPPIFDMEEVIEMIHSNKLDSRQRAFLAMSTTFGFRRGEIGSLTAESFNFDDASFRVLILKSREWRTHTIPHQITPTLIKYGFRESLSPPSMSRIFNLIKKRCGFGHRKGYKGYSWHAIRRRLAIELDNLGSLTYRELHQFMNWKSSSTFRGQRETISPILMRYTEREPHELDLKVFEVHPFLKYWE